MNKDITSVLPKLMIVAAVIAVGLTTNYLSASWTPPPSTPPLNNVDTPINVGGVYQEESGPLSLLSSLVVYGGFALPDGSQGAGKVLVSDQHGVASWQDFSGGTIGSSCQLERTAVMSPDGVGGGGQYQDRCNGLLSASARAAGWIPTGSDACAEDGNTCTVDGVSCYFARLTCNGMPIPTSFTSYTPAQAQAAGFY